VTTCQTTEVQKTQKYENEDETPTEKTERSPDGRHT
jgi:hypothetical protein